VKLPQGRLWLVGSLVLYFLAMKAPFICAKRKKKKKKRSEILHIQLK